MATERKKFLPVEIPLLKREIELLAHSSEDLGNRFIKLDLTPELKGKNIELKLKVSLQEGKPVANPIELYLLGSYIRRIMRKGTDYVEDSFPVKCKDQSLIAKPFLITRKKVSRNVRAALREATKKEFVEYAKSRTFDELIMDVLNNRAQKDLSIKLKKIYPLGVCEIRFLGIINEKSYSEKFEKEKQVIKKEEKDQEEEKLEKKQYRGSKKDRTEAKVESKELEEKEE